MLFTQMPRTSSDKLFLGKEYINKLSCTHLCTSFHGGVTKCKCIQKAKEHLVDVKQYFLEAIDEWKISAHWKHRTDAKAIGHFFGEYIYERSTHTSKFSKYVYHIADRDMEFCLDTLNSIYDLNQKAMTAAQDLLIDRKAIGLNLFNKKACGEDWKSNQKLYWIYTNWFGHQIDPMGPKNSSAGVILKKLGGFMVQLDQGSMHAIDYINAHDCPKISEFNNVSNGGDNIRFAGPGYGLPDWGFFDGKRVLRPFIKQVVQHFLIIGETRMILFSDMKLPLFTPSLVISETMCPRRLIMIIILASLIKKLIL